MGSEPTLHLFLRPMTVYDIEKTNFITILRSGAFDDSKPIGMLSDFKWNKLIELAHIHDVVNIFAQGLEHYYYDDNLNLSESHLGKIRTLLQETPTHTIPELYDIDKVHLHSTALESKLREIVGQEQKDTERSFETLQLAAILFENVNHILSGRSFLRGIIDLGRYLRQDGNRIDFVKLERWLQQTKMTKMAQMQGNLLIEAFGFSAEELPFVARNDHRAKEVLDGAIRTNVTRDGQKWEFHQNKSGFIVGSPQQALRSIRHSLRYRRYARREAYSTIFRGILKGLSEIEE